jgi:hypothetical protein
MTSRRNAPVFVVGSPRSGTTLLYDMLLSAGGFAIYRSEARVFDMIAPRFGDLRVRRNKEKLLRHYLPSEFFARSGLPAEQFKARILADCRNAGDFLRILMESVMTAQHADRWAECTPTNALHMHEIKRTLPEALFVHIVRDGRDVALSLEQQGWIRPFPWDRKEGVLVAGLYWEWLVGKGRHAGRHFPSDYVEVHFEDLVNRPRETLTTIGAFIEHDLDYDRIQKVAIGTVGRPNTSFDSTGQQAFNPVGRWKSDLSPGALAEFECLIGPFLQEVGYSRTVPDGTLRMGFRLQSMRHLYRLWFGAKQLAKANTPLARFLVNIDLLADFCAHDRDRIKAKALR